MATALASRAMPAPGSTTLPLEGLLTGGIAAVVMTEQSESCWWWSGGPKSADPLIRPTTTISCSIDSSSISFTMASLS